MYPQKYNRNNPFSPPPPPPPPSSLTFNSTSAPASASAPAPAPVSTFSPTSFPPPRSPSSSASASGSASGSASASASASTSSDPRSAPTIATVRRLAATADSRYPSPRLVSNSSQCQQTISGPAAAAAAIAASTTSSLAASKPRQFSANGDWQRGYSYVGSNPPRKTSGGYNGGSGQQRERIPLATSATPPSTISPRHYRHPHHPPPYVRTRGAAHNESEKVEITGAGARADPYNAPIPVSTAASSSSSMTVTPSGDCQRPSLSSTMTSTSVSTLASSSTSMSTSTPTSPSIATASASAAYEQTDRLGIASSATSSASTRSVTTATTTSRRTSSLQSQSRCQSQYTSAGSRKGTPDPDLVAVSATESGDHQSSDGSRCESLTSDTALPSISTTAVTALGPSRCNDSARHTVTNSSGCNSPSATASALASASPNGPAKSLSSGNSSLGSDSVSASSRGSSDSDNASPSRTTAAPSFQANLNLKRSRHNHHSGTVVNAETVHVDETATAIASTLKTADTVAVAAAAESSECLPDERTENSDNQHEPHARSTAAAPQQLRHPTRKMSVFELARMRLAGAIPNALSSAPAPTSAPTQLGTM
ncbi:hypothetical protein KEM54_005544 [Ascosphaera aggregata]|nr:hypothetical protein KEM54_005544 [Ascosphaera aggregata]